MEEKEITELLSDQEIIKYIGEKLDIDRVYFGDKKEEYEKARAAYIEAYNTGRTPEDLERIKELKIAYINIAEGEREARESLKTNQDELFPWQALRELELASMAAEVSDWQMYIEYLGSAYDTLWLVDEECSNLVMKLMIKTIKGIGIEGDPEQYLYDQGIIH